MKLYRIKNRQSFGFSAENPTGQKNGGTKGKDCEKLRPCIQIAPGETVTLCDTDGPQGSRRQLHCFKFSENSHGTRTWL